MPLLPRPRPPAKKPDQEPINQIRDLQLRLIDKQDKLAVADDTIEVLEDLITKYLNKINEQKYIIDWLKSENEMLRGMRDAKTP